MNNQVTMFTSSNLNYSIITQEEVIENDKSRLKRKFLLQSFHTNYDDQMTNLSNQSMNTSMKKEKEKYNKITHDKISQDNVSMKSQSSDTQVENRVILDRHLRTNKLLFPKREENSSNNNYYSSSIDDCLDDELYSRSNNFTNNYKTNQTGGIEQILNPFTSNKPNSDYPHQKKKLINLFNNNDESNILSIGLLGDEHIRKINITDNKQCRFISEIQKDNLKIPSLPIIKLKHLHHKAIVNILSYIFEDHESLINSANWFKDKILLSLSSVYVNLIANFKTQYKDIIDMEEYYFKVNKFERRRSVYPFFDLMIRGRIIIKPQFDTSYRMNYCYNNNEGNSLMNSFIIDVKRNKTFPIWFTNESEEYLHKKKWYSYSQSIHSLCYGDTIVLRINLFSMGMDGDFTSFKWLPLICNVNKQPIGFYEKSMFHNDIEFDYLRHSEIERIVLLWKKEEIPRTHVSLIDEFKNIYSKLFRKIDVCYYQSKLHYFKITMEAYKLGVIIKNNFFNASIEVVNTNLSIEQECFCLELLGIQLSAANYQIRKGTKVVFYIIDS